MKILIKLMIFVLLLCGIFYVLRDAYHDYAAVCQESLSYKISEIDERFGISREEVLVVMQEAEDVWEVSLDRDLFVYDPEAELEIEFVFDERQEKTFHALELEQELALSKANNNLLEKDVQEVNEQYQQEVAFYNQISEQYSTKLNAYNQEVQKYNSRGGASTEVIKKLDKDIAQLQKLYEDVDDQRVQVNALVTSSKGKINQLNASVADINADVTEYNNIFEPGVAFEQGVFNSEKGIAIYQYRGRDDLRAVLAHEIGHALGADHVDATEAIMHYLMRDQDLENPELHPADIAAMEEVCRQKTIGEFGAHLRKNLNDAATNASAHLVESL